MPAPPSRSACVRIERAAEERSRAAARRRHLGFDLGLDRLNGDLEILPFEVEVADFRGGERADRIGKRDLQSFGNAADTVSEIAKGSQLLARADWCGIGGGDPAVRNVNQMQKALRRNVSGHDAASRLGT